jgi:hypothetical protein
MLSCCQLINRKVGEVAKMYPRVFPNVGVEGRGAEKYFFEACANQLNDEWTVLYEVPFHGERRRTGKIPTPGEIDFVLIHARHGIYVVEVKGGSQISVDSGNWFTTRHDNGEKYEIQNPFTQASDGVRNLLSFLSEKVYQVQFKNGVIKPLVVFTGHVQHGAISLDGKRELICDKEDLSHLEMTLKKVGKYFITKSEFSPQDVKLIREAIQPSFIFPGKNLEDFRDAIDGLDLLTEEQLTIVSGLYENKKLIVRGGAGTGKTILAFNRARELAELGQKVLLVCSNIALRNQLINWRDALGEVNPKQFQISTAVNFVHNIGSLLEASGHIGAPGESDESNEGFKDELAKRNLSGILGELDDSDVEFEDWLAKRDLIGPPIVGEVPVWDVAYTAIEDALTDDMQLDALIVDEAQNISYRDIEMIYVLVKTEGSVVLFGDENQQLNFSTEKETALEFLDAATKFRLSINCRNTKEISDVAHKYTFDANINLRGHSGPVPRIVSKTKARMFQGIGDEAFRILNDYGMEPSQVNILTINESRASFRALRDLFPNSEAKFALGISQSGKVQNRILVSAIHEFQGLESDAIVAVITKSALMQSMNFATFERFTKKQMLSRRNTSDVGDLNRVKEQFSSYRNRCVQKAEDMRETFLADEPTLSAKGLDEVVNAYKRELTSQFIPEWRSPNYKRFWTECQRKALRVQLYSLMTRAKVVLSIVAEEDCLDTIKTEFARQSNDDLDQFAEFASSD